MATNKTLVIAIYGGTNSGKTTLANIIEKRYEADTMIISQDSFYIPGDETTNYDHPDSIEFSMLVDCVQKAKQGLEVLLPVYDFMSHGRKEVGRILEPKPIIIIEGILIMTCPELEKLCDFKIFVHSELDTMYRRRSIRDQKYRGRTQEQINKQWDRDVKPMHLKYVKPTESNANITINNDQNNILTNPDVIPQISIVLTYVKSFLSCVGDK